jgi:hypothetical protein
MVTDERVRETIGEVQAETMGRRKIEIIVEVVDGMAVHVMSVVVPEGCLQITVEVILGVGVMEPAVDARRRRRDVGELESIEARERRRSWLVCMPWVVRASQMGARRDVWRREVWRTKLLEAVLHVVVVVLVVSPIAVIRDVTMTVVVLTVAMVVVLAVAIALAVPEVLVEVVLQVGIVVEIVVVVTPDGHGKAGMVVTRGAEQVVNKRRLLDQRGHRPVARQKLVALDVDRSLRIVDIGSVNLSVSCVVARIRSSQLPGTRPSFPPCAERRAT